MVEEASSVALHGFYGSETESGRLSLNIFLNEVTELNLQGSINTWPRSGQNSIEVTVENWSNWTPSDSASTSIICLNRSIL